jgi:hypothetical protein
VDDSRGMVELKVGSAEKLCQIDNLVLGVSRVSQCADPS